MSKVFDQVRGNFRSMNLFPSINITPSLAAELLTLNTDNRPMRDNITAGYATDMKKDKWTFNGDIIRISRSGRLLDGQHRLAAIIKSEKPQVFHIQTGLKDETFDVIDTGKVRSATDIFHIAGHTSGGHLATAIRLIKDYYGGRLMVRPGHKSTQRPTNHNLIEWMKDNNEALLKDCVSQSIRLHSKAKLLGPGTIGAFMYLFSLKDREHAQYFWNLVFSGENISSIYHSMIYLLREKMIAWTTTTKIITNTEKYACIIKAWNDYRAGKEIKRLSWSVERDEFPKIK